MRNSDRTFGAARLKPLDQFLFRLLDDDEYAGIAHRLWKDGANLAYAFSWLELYINREGRSSIPLGRAQRKKAFNTIVNSGVREYGVPESVGRWFQHRAELAFSTQGFSRVHISDALVGAHIYLEAATGRHVSMRELAALLGAANQALGRQPAVVDSQSVGRELTRYRKNHPDFFKLLESHIRKTIKGP